MKPERQVLHDLVLPPNAITSEQSLIGGLLLDNMAWDKIADIVAEVDFYRDDHRRIFRHIAKLIEVGRPADVVTVYESLEKSNESEQAGGLAYLGEIANNTPSAANIRGYAEVVAIRSREREALAAAEQFRSDILGKGSLQDAATRLGNAVQSIAERSKSIRDFDEVDVSAFLATQPAPIDWLAEERIQLGRGGSAGRHRRFFEDTHALSPRDWRNRRPPSLGLVYNPNWFRGAGAGRRHRRGRASDPGGHAQRDWCNPGRARARRTQPSCPCAGREGMPPDRRA
jgi:hypothetical protein